MNQSLPGRHSMPDRADAGRASASESPQMLAHINRLNISLGGVAVALLGALASTASTAPATAQPDTTGTFSCRLAGPLGTLRDLPEASGLAISRRHAGLLWSH